MTDNFYRLRSEVRFLLVVRVAEMIRRNVSTILTYHDMTAMLGLSFAYFQSKTVYDQFAGVMTPKFIKTASLEKMHRTLDRIFTRSGYMFGLSPEVEKDMTAIFYLSETASDPRVVQNTRSLFRNREPVDSVLKAFESLRRITTNETSLEKRLRINALDLLARRVYLAPHHDILPPEIFHYAFDIISRYRDAFNLTQSDIDAQLDAYYETVPTPWPRMSKDQWEGAICSTSILGGRRPITWEYHHNSLTVRLRRSPSSKSITIAYIVSDRQYR